MSKMLFVAALAAGLFAAPALAQEAAPRSEVQIYRAAPGHQRQLLQFLAQQEEAAKAAGLAASQLYIHQSGASWDFVMISPHNTEAQEKAIDAAAIKLGIPTGPKMGLQFREHVAEHSDTIAAGPNTVAEWLKRIDK